MPMHEEMTIEKMIKAKTGEIVSIGCRNCEGLERHEKQANGKWKCLNCGFEEIEFKKLKTYRVWHTSKERCSKFDGKESTELTANTMAKARKTVQEMYPDHRITSVILIEK